MVFESFPKIEKQFYWDKAVKERCIFGPIDEKKCMANPFIKELEGIAHAWFEPYCGRKNWIEISADLDKKLQTLREVMFAEADGSGFDMSQTQNFHRLMNELIMTCARHPNVQWDDPLNTDDLKNALENSLELEVSVDHGEVRYKADGRASGDGWTTYANTMLMISYWLFTFDLAGVDENEVLLRVKGDDVIVGADEENAKRITAAQKLVFTFRKDKHTHGLAQIGDP
jgi:hypothetical protein